MMLTISLTAIFLILIADINGYNMELNYPTRLSLFCGPNESFSLCRKCERDCDGQLEPDCKPSCGIPKCYCNADKGLVRSRKGVCVPMESCKNWHQGCFGFSCPPGQYCETMSSAFCVVPPCRASPKCLPLGMPPF